MFFQTVFVSLIAVMLGLVVCFAGFRLFVILLPIWAFFAGFLATAQAVQQLFGGGFLATTSSWLFGLVIGLLFAVAAYFFYYAAIGILAATVGYELGTGVMAGLGVSSQFLHFIVGLVIAVALVAAVILLNLPKVFIVVLTAFGGAGMIVSGVLLGLGRIPLSAYKWGLVGTFIHASWFWSLIYIAVAAIGIVTQMLLPEAYALTPYGQEQPSLQAPTGATGPSGRAAPPSAQPAQTVAAPAPTSAEPRLPAV